MSHVTSPQCERMGPHLDYFQIRDSHLCWLQSCSCGHEHCRLNFKGTPLSLFWEHQRQTEVGIFEDSEDGGGYRWRTMSGIYLVSKGLTYIFGLESRCLSTWANVLAQLETLSVYFVIDFLWPGFNSWGNASVLSEISSETRNRHMVLDGIPRWYQSPACHSHRVCEEWGLAPIISTQVTGSLRTIGPDLGLGSQTGGILNGRIPPLTPK